MNDLNDVVKRILIKNGFSDVIPLHEREYQLRTIETLLILLWMILSVFLIRSLSLALTWFLLVIICLTVEQLINVSSLWLSHRRKRERIRFQNSPAFRQSLNRPIYQRINIAFCILFSLALFFLLSSTLPNPPGWFLVTQVTFLSFFAADSIAEKQKVRGTVRAIFVSLGLEAGRGWRQIVSIITQGFTLAISGIVIAVILGSISQDFWLLTGQIGGVSLLIVLGLLFFSVIIPSSASINQSVEHELRAVNLIQEPFSAEKLYQAAVRRTSYDQARALTRSIFNTYEAAFGWKLRKPVYETAFTDLMNELKMRAKWQFWLSLFGLLPLTFTLITLISVTVFPSHVLAEWTKKPIPYNLLSLLVSQIVDFLRGNGHPLSISLWEDPVIKFSAISTCLILTYLANSYSQDSRKIFTNLHMDKGFLTDLVVLLSAYHILREEEYQGIGSFYTPIGKRHHSVIFIAPVVLIPNNAGKLLVLKIIGRIRENLDLPGKLICAILIPMKLFLSSISATRMNIDGIEDLPITNNVTTHNQMQCWVWLDEGDKMTGLYAFDNFEEASDWIIKNTKG